MAELPYHFSLKNLGITDRLAHQLRPSFDRPSMLDRELVAIAAFYKGGRNYFGGFQRLKRAATNNRSLLLGIN